MRQASLDGPSRLVTGALTPAEQEPFLLAGFTVHDRLHLLRHDLVDIPPSPTIEPALRRARRADHDPALAVDARAFDAFWRLDRAGLDDAVNATGTARFRVAVDTAHPKVVGYAVTGRSGDRGYLQRLAVDPDRRGQGIGGALVIDALRWLRRRRAASVVVNTQVGNEDALRLYRRLGFVPEPWGLAVLTYKVDRAL
jgi:GNAT superfamily N-acetyltransferase